tara:strand:- start:804 stop:1331 length:528 start_codon:yes stop_codon:yes gene_type:complete
VEPFVIDFTTREGVSKAVFAKLKHVQDGDWLTPQGFGFSTAQHNFRDYINVVIGRLKYGVNCHTVSGSSAVRNDSFPMTANARIADQVIREHAVPSKVLWDIAQTCSCWQDCETLIELFTIVILSKSEDQMITLQSSMPNGWQIGDSVYARYEGLPFYDELIENVSKHVSQLRGF